MGDSPHQMAKYQGNIQTNVCTSVQAWHKQSKHPNNALSTVKTTSRCSLPSGCGCSPVLWYKCSCQSIVLQWRLCNITHCNIVTLKHITHCIAMKALQHNACDNLRWAECETCRTNTSSHSFITLDSQAAFGKTCKSQKALQALISRFWPAWLCA